MTNVTYKTKEVNLTSITTLITPYPNATSTNVVTNVYLTNASFPVTQTLGNPIENYPNNAFYMTELDTQLNGTAVTTAGVTMYKPVSTVETPLLISNRQSPQAFYVYTTVKIITARPVVATDGQIMCGTVSSWPRPNFYDVQATFSNINSNAEAHFGGSSIGGAAIIPTATATHTYFSILDSLTFRYTSTETAVGTWFTDLRGHTVEPTMASSGLEITLTTPFIYQPTRGANAATEDPEACFQGDGTENFGYVPQTLVDYLARDPHYLSLYPDLTSCLPAGPSILPVMEACKVPFAEIIQSGVGGDLTDSTVSTVLPSRVVVEGEVAPGTTTPTPTPSVGSIINSVMNASPSPAGPSVGSTTIVSGTPLLVITPTSIPVQNAPPGLTGSTTVVDGTSLLVIPNRTTIPALPGSITIVSGSTFAVFTGPTTVPANPNLPLEGSTTVISGTTMVVLSSATAVPVLPGSLTVLSGSVFDVFTGPTTIPVNGELSLSGQTTVIGGVTEVILSKATTVPVNKPTGPNFLQVSGATRGRNSIFGFVVEVVRGFAVRFR